MCNSQDTEASILGKAFLEEQNNIELAYAQQSLIARKNQLKQIYGRIFKDGIMKQLSIAFFKTDKTKEQLQALNAIYKPGDIHSWGANLAWLLGHLRRANQFVVCSDILSHQYRRGFQSEEIPCAFARELCVALKAGYTLCKNETGVILKPLSLTLEYLQKCDSTGVLGDGVNPTYEEVAEVYRQLEEVNWNGQKNFECSFDFKDGVVQIKVLSQPEIPSATDISRELASVLENITDLSGNLEGISEGRPAVLNQFTPQALEQETLVQSVYETNKPASEGVDRVISSGYSRPQK